MRGWGIAFVLLLSGCVAEEPAGAPETVVDVDPPLRTANGTRVEAPEHPVGRAWTFTGTQLYNPDSEIIVVVARADADGYLFAGAAEDDVHYDALWSNPLYGERDRSLVRKEWRPYLRFPLEDSATWAFSDTITLTARAAPIRTPTGEEDGFVITGANERVRLRWDYSPQLGQIVHHSAVAADGRVFDDYRLTRVQEGRAWVWYERGPIAVAGNPHEPAAFEVPEGYDAVIVSAGGTDGGRAFVQGPAGEAWSTQFSGEEEWHHGTLPATSGRWVAQVVGRPFLDEAPPVDAPLGWAYAHVAPVRWVRS